MDVVTIVAIDDQNDTLELIKEVLDHPKYRLHVFNDPTLALAEMADLRVDIVLTDLQMPQKSGFDVLNEVKTKSPSTEVIVLTAYGDIEMAVSAMKTGATDFFTKPLRVPELRTVIGRLAELQIMRRRLKDLSGDDIAPVGSGPAMQNVLSMARVVAETDCTVLITGETGVGKEVLADYIQRRSARNNAPFVKVNCAALPESLLESELFGHERGAFTGAAERRIGRFERAHRGTLFLDEIAELPPSVQVKLLRVLQNREIERIGGNATVPVDFRLICATHRNLPSMTMDGSFREDLLYRINVFPIHIPPLRDSSEDIPALAHHFLKRAQNKIGRGPNSISTEAIDKLMQFDWPGNVRQLENAIERACVLARGPVLTPDLIILPQNGRNWMTSTNTLPVSKAESRNNPASSTPTPPPGSEPMLSCAAAQGNGNGSHHERQVPRSAQESASFSRAALQASSEAQAMQEAAANLLSASSGSWSTGATGVPWDMDAENPLEEAEKVTLSMVLEKCRWNYKRAAEVLKMSRSTLYAKANRYGIRRQ